MTETYLHILFDHYGLYGNAQGVVANGGTEYKVDVIVLATGFETSFTLPGHQDAALVRRKVEAHGFKIFGRGGRSLGEHWVLDLTTSSTYITRNLETTHD